VLGNVDTYDDALANFPESTGVSVEGLSYAVHVGGKPSVLIHGHVRREFDQAVESGNNAYVFTGHTHVPEDRSVGPTRIINPGAVYRASEPSVAVLDDISGQVTWIPLL
jgi:predicted phosphodiesterase